MKKIQWLCLLLLVVALCACNANKTPQTLRVMALKGPSGVGMAQLMEQSAENKTKLNYEFTLGSTPDEAVAALTSGNADIAALPLNTAALLYNKTSGKIQMLSTSTLGVLHILEAGDTIHSVEDLRGKTLYATGQGAMPEYVLNAILRGNGLEPGVDVIITYKSEHSELATLAGAGEVTLCMLPEPNVTAAMAKNENLRIALDLTQEWNKLDMGQLVMGVIAVRADYAKENPQAVKTFLEEYAASIQAVNADPQAAGAWVEKAGIMPQAALATKAIPNCNIYFSQGQDMKDITFGLLEMLFDTNPQILDGSMPDGGFFYIP